MTATNFKDFKTLITRIPKERFENFWLFPLRQDRKNPDCPVGAVLKGNLAYRLSVRDSIGRLKQGKNVGIYALTGGLLFLDLDVEKSVLKASNEFLSEIVPTFCVRTRNGGLQYYYLNDGLYGNQIIKENGIEIGELRTDWYYVVSAGSYVKPDSNNGNGDGTYRVINDIPMVAFSGLEEYIEKKETKLEETKTFSKKTEVKPGVKIEDYEKKLKEKARIRRKVSDDVKKALLAKYKLTEYFVTLPEKAMELNTQRRN